MSDFRYDNPQPGEFPFELLPPRLSSPAAICCHCWSSFAEQCHPVNEEYLKEQRLLSEALSIQVADVAGGLLAPQDKNVQYGCWFGYYPGAAESRQFAGMRLIDLYAMGVISVSSRGVPRRFLDDFVIKATFEDADGYIPVDTAVQMTEDIKLADGELTIEDRLAIAKCRVWILDVTLILDHWQDCVPPNK